MKTKTFTSIMVFLSFISGVAFADRSMERGEILQIFQKLTNQPRKTWIPAGTIEATHEEYRAPKMMDANMVNSQIRKAVQLYQRNPNKRELAEELQKMRLDAEPFNVRYNLSNEYTMSSLVVVRFDGDRFYWEINVNSRTDSVKPDKNLKDNFMTDEFNLDWNTKRIFAWDGEKYTTYFLPGNHAIVDTTGRTPHVVNGPLTAGLIPWGYGYYTYENLSATDSSAVEEYIDGQPQIHLTLDNHDGSQMVFVMDPQKDCAVTSCLITRPGYAVTSKHYSGYQSVAGNWIPSAISLEQYEAGSNRLLASDLWNITSIDVTVPESYNFEVDYETDALIEHFSLNPSKPGMYRYSRRVDTDQLLAERMTYADSENTQLKNCATVTLKYVASQFGKNVTDQQLAQLVDEPNRTTTLYQMKQFAQGLGLYCRAVKTDIRTLKSLQGCQVILHIPGKKHFVVLGAIDDKYVWTIDLASRKFYGRTNIDFFGMDWTEGTALLISNNAVEGRFAEIEERELSNINGASGYQCNVLRQEDNVILCDFVGGECGGVYRVFYERWGCGLAESGSCSQSPMVRYEKSPCIEYSIYSCDVAEEWTAYYMMACY
ncbi:MAG: cysteine peptidase family C39 domain-containing protein [Phycisphaerae bacterium]|nr:cysteine peptidase family C39 domain-containing protein [Phycisphaerae bacterium]